MIAIQTPVKCYRNDYGAIQAQEVPPDPAKAFRCTRTVATLGDHECRVDSLTRDVYDRRGRELRYVGRSAGDVAADVAAWQAWLRGMGMA